MKCEKVQDYFMYYMGWIYLWAFTSVYYQIPGLYGDNGVLPIRYQLKCESSDWTECMFGGDKPSLLYKMMDILKMTPSDTMEIAALMGVFLAALTLIFRPMRDTTIYALLWFLYLSCFQVGQTFLWFQWDTLLLEAGFLTILVAPFRLFRVGDGGITLPHDRIALFLVKWLVFRMMFASGVVKLTSECPTWWGLTALNYHFESQCIPTPLSWFAHQLPKWILKLGVTSTYLVEILIPPLFLLPVKHIRKFAFYMQILFMIGIIATGNYNFFNLLYSVICIPLLLDSDDSAFGSHVLYGRFGRVYTIIKGVAIGSIYGALTYWTVHLFHIRLSKDYHQLLTDIGFSEADLYRVLSWSVPLFIMIGTVLLFTEIASAVIRCAVDMRSRYCLAEVWSMGQTLVMSGIALYMFAISLVPFAYLDRGAHDMLFPEIHAMHAKADKFQVTHSYGLFRQMTGVGGRPEVVLQGSDSVNGTFKDIEFMYKPGDLSRQPSFVVPHQPRLDWQMWFAALGEYRRNPWFVSMVYRIMKNEPEVLKLVNNNDPHFKVPKFIRAQLYHYHFTSADSKNKRYSSKDWWWRELKGEYFPVMSADNPSLTEYLENNHFIVPEKEQKRPKKEGERLNLIELMRKISETFPPHIFIWVVSFSVLVVQYAGAQ